MTGAGGGRVGGSSGGVGEARVGGGAGLASGGGASFSLWGECVCLCRSAGQAPPARGGCQSRAGQRWGVACRASPARIPAGSPSDRPTGIRTGRTPPAVAVGGVRCAVLRLGLAAAIGRRGSGWQGETTIVRSILISRAVRRRSCLLPAARAILGTICAISGPGAGAPQSRSCVDVGWGRWLWRGCACGGGGDAGGRGSGCGNECAMGVGSGG